MLRRIIFHKRCLVIYTKSGLKCLKLSALCPFSSSLLGVIIYVLNVHLCTAKLYGLEVAKEDLVWSANRLYSDFQGRIQGGGILAQQHPLASHRGCFWREKGKNIEIHNICSIILLQFLLRLYLSFKVNEKCGIISFNLIL